MNLYNILIFLSLAPKIPAYGVVILLPKFRTLQYRRPLLLILNYTELPHHMSSQKLINEWAHLGNMALWRLLATSFNPGLATCTKIKQYGFMIFIFLMSKRLLEHQYILNFTMF